MIPWIEEHVLFISVFKNISFLSFLFDISVMKRRNSLLFRFSLSYSLTIKAADLGVPQHSATAIYTIAIQDENDNSPIFTSTTYRAYIKENSPTGSLIIRVRCFCVFWLFAYFLVGWNSIFICQHFGCFIDPSANTLLHTFVPQ